AGLAAAALAAEEALCLQRAALAVLTEGWSGESGSTATDLVARQCAEGADLVEVLHRVAGESALLRDTASAPDASAAPPVPPVVPSAAAPAQAGPMPGAAGLPLPALPDIGGALVNLIAQIADAIPDPAQPDLVPDGEGRPDGVSSEHRPPPPVKEPVPQPVVAQEPAPLAPPIPPATPGPLLAAELPPPPAEPEAAPAGPDAVPADPRAAPVPAAPVTPEPVAEPAAQPKTPCEIAADELPQVGE
ncbi:MAG: hypothetical protein ACR2JM_15000, partial [Mycobacterium sp.]